MPISQSMVLMEAKCHRIFKIVLKLRADFPRQIAPFKITLTQRDAKF